MSEELKPCPFCGSQENEFGNHPETCFLYRIKQQFRTDCAAYCREDIEWSWNRRTKVTPPVRLGTGA